MQMSQTYRLRPEVNHECDQGPGFLNVCPWQDFWVSVDKHYVPYSRTFAKFSVGQENELLRISYVLPHTLSSVPMRSRLSQQFAQIRASLTLDLLSEAHLRAITVTYSQLQQQVAHPSVLVQVPHICCQIDISTKGPKWAKLCVLSKSRRIFARLHVLTSQQTVQLDEWLFFFADLNRSSPQTDTRDGNWPLPHGQYLFTSILTFTVSL
jgi:hypothetical protein